MSQKRIEILYADEALVAISKPPGVSVTADRSGDADLLQLLAGQRPDWTDLRLVHRLDKETSGVMVLAHGRDNQSALSRAFAKRRVRKVYLALVNGCPPGQRGRIGQPMARSRRDPRRMRIDPRRGKPAITEYEVLADFGGLSLLAVRPQTGRTHQIRLHLANAGLPLAIDPLYGSGDPLLLSQFKPGYRHKPDRPESPLIDRLTLHSYSLEFRDEDVCRAGPLVAPPERKFAAAIKMLAKHGPKGPNHLESPDIIEHLLSGRVLDN